MAGSVTVFSSKCWAKCIHVTHATCVGFYVDLATDSQEGRLAEKVCAIVYLALFQWDKRGFFLFLFLSWSSLGGFSFSSWLFTFGGTCFAFVFLGELLRISL